LEAGRLLKAHEYSFDCAYTSLLKRAIRTLWFVLDELDLMWIPVEKSWRLNERQYGALQGLNKATTAKRYSDEQVHLWRRSYDVPPPVLTKDDNRHPIHDPRYTGLPEGDLPCTLAPSGAKLASTAPGKPLSRCTSNRVFYSSLGLTR